MLLSVSVAVPPLIVGPPLSVKPVPLLNPVMSARVETTTAPTINNPVSNDDLQEETLTKNFSMFLLPPMCRLETCNRRFGFSPTPLKAERMVRAIQSTSRYIRL